MRNRHRFGIWAAAVAVACIVAAPVSARVLTVGDFLRDVATAKHLPAQDAAVAETSLRAAGYSLPPVDRNARLTEGAVAAISTSMGLPVTTGNPAAAFDQPRLDRYMTAVASRLDATRAGAVDTRSAVAEKSGSGRGKKKPHSKSPKKPKPPKPPKT